MAIIFVNWVRMFPDSEPIIIPHGFRMGHSGSMGYAWVRMKKPLWVLSGHNGLTHLKPERDPVGLAIWVWLGSSHNLWMGVGWLAQLEKGKDLRARKWKGAKFECKTLEGGHSHASQLIILFLGCKIITQLWRWWWVIPTRGSDASIVNNIGIVLKY